MLPLRRFSTKRARDVVLANSQHDPESEVDVNKRREARAGATDRTESSLVHPQGRRVSRPCAVHLSRERKSEKKRSVLHAGTIWTTVHCRAIEMNSIAFEVLNPNHGYDPITLSIMAGPRGCKAALPSVTRLHAPVKRKGSLVVIRYG